MKAGDSLHFWPHGWEAGDKKVAELGGTLEVLTFLHLVNMRVLAVLHAWSWRKTEMSKTQTLPSRTLRNCSGLTISTTRILMHYHNKPVTFSVPISQMAEPSLRVQIYKAISSQNCNDTCWASVLRVFPIYYTALCVLEKSIEAVGELDSGFHIIRGWQIFKGGCSSKICNVIRATLTWPSTLDTG